MTPTVSVVTVVSNVQRFLAEAVESILSQTFKDFEYVIVDFGSTDNSQLLIVWHYRLSLSKNIQRSLCWVHLQIRSAPTGSH